MEENRGKRKNEAPKTENLIDPIYKKFTKSILRTLGSTEFYQYFMDAVSRSQTSIQFSNRRLEKTVDPSWLDMIESSLESMDRIINSPRNVIKEEELIVNVAHAKKFNSEVVRHLAQHASMVEDYNEETGEVVPNKVMQKYREESAEMYENRVVYTAMERAYHFVKIRHDAIFDAMNEELGAKLRVNTIMSTSTEHVNMDFYMSITDLDSPLETDEKNQDVFGRISRLYRLLSSYMNSEYAQRMSQFNRVQGHLVETNVLARNPDYHKLQELYEFLQAYEDVGYSLQIVEQNPKVSEQFQRDIYHNILFNYIVLKGYLENEKDRRIPSAARSRRRSLKPKFIHEIIEELTEDYDLPDVEVRKVLIEELTKEQLMQEEEEERRRLVAEQEERLRKEEEDRLKAQLEEEERARKLREIEAERERLALEAEKKRQEQEERARRAEEWRRGQVLRRELDYFRDHLGEHLAQRGELQEENADIHILDFADAAQLLERREEEKRQAERERRRKIREEEERQRLAEKLALQEEEARREEQRRLEEEALQRELLERLEAERAAREEQRRLDEIQSKPLSEELVYFQAQLSRRRSMRVQQSAQLAREAGERELAHKRRMEARAAGSLK